MKKIFSILYTIAKHENFCIIVFEVIKMTERKIRKLLLSSIPIETERLILRYIEPDDAYDMYEYASIPSVSEFLLWYPHVNLEATEGYIEFLQKRYLRGLYADWAVVLKENGKMIGTCGYAAIEPNTGIFEIGYVLSPSYRHCGYMTEAVNAVLELSFNKLSFSKAILRIIDENTSSIRLAERIGFKLDQIGYAEMNIKEKMRNIAHYSMTVEEYKKMKQS